MLMMTCHSQIYAQTPDPKTLDTLSEQAKAAQAKANAFSKKQQFVETEIAKLKNELINATAKSRGYEHEANRIYERITDLQTEKQALNDLIFKDRTALIDLLAAMQRIEKNPPPAFLLNTQNTIDAARAGMLMASLSQDLQNKTELLSLRLGELQDIETKLTSNRNAFTQNSQEIETRLAAMQVILSSKSKLSNTLKIDQKSQTKKAQDLAAKAENLRDLIRSFEEQAGSITPRIKPPILSQDPSPSLKPKRNKKPAPLYISPQFGRFADARGKLPLPVLGRLSRKYGAKLKDGSRAAGVYLNTRPKAQVIAPFPGKIEFSGAFNGQHVIILNVGNGYFIVLTGLGRTNVAAGEFVKAGEPIGLMPTDAKPQLFMEFRKNKASIDPSPWVKHAFSQK